MGKQEETDEFVLAISATHLLHRAQQAAVNLSAGALAMKGLTIRQFAVLAALHDENGQSQSSLVDATGIDRSTLADMVQRMEKGGLVKRVKSEDDARAKAVSLTSAGEKAFQDGAPTVAEADSILLSGLRSTRRESLIKALTIIAGEYEDEDEHKGKKGKKKKKKKKKKA
ncbi:MAG: MarR family transcriptional regulator [Pseudomonadota bacterium]